MKNKAVRLFLLTLGLFLLLFTGPSLAIDYSFYRDPVSPSTGEIVDLYADSSWANDTNNFGSMEFYWLQFVGGDTYIQTSNYISGEYNGNDYDYFSYYRIREEGKWSIHYVEYDLDFGSGNVIGSGTETFQVTVPEFSSYIFVIISFLSIYFILRKKIIS